MEQNKQILVQQFCMPIVATAISSPKKWEDLSPELQMLVRKCCSEVSRFIDYPDFPQYKVASSQIKPCQGC